MKTTVIFYKSALSGTHQPDNFNAETNKGFWEVDDVGLAQLLEQVMDSYDFGLNTKTEISVADVTGKVSTFITGETCTVVDLGVITSTPIEIDAKNGFHQRLTLGVNLVIDFALNPLKESSQIILDIIQDDTVAYTAELGANVISRGGVQISNSASLSSKDRLKLRSFDDRNYWLENHFKDFKSIV